MSIRKACLATLPVVLLAACNPPDAPPAPSAASESAPRAEAAGVASRDFGSHVLHFNAITTDQLTPDVAKAYDIVRSNNRALLNVSLVKKIEGTTGQPVPATVTALVVNDTGQVKDTKLREIRDGEAYYYVADFPVSNAETLVFTVDATPQGESTPLSVRFTRTFYSR